MKSRGGLLQDAIAEDTHDQELSRQRRPDLQRHGDKQNENGQLREDVESGEVCPERALQYELEKLCSPVSW